MECLVPLHMTHTCSCQHMGEVEVSIDVRQEIKDFIQANPLQAIGIAAALTYLLVTLIKSK